MRLLVIGALIIGLGAILLIGLWAMANALYSQSIFGVPFGAYGKSTSDCADEEQSASSSATLIRGSPASKRVVRRRIGD
jgi:hypothetical protein